MTAGMAEIGWPFERAGLTEEDLWLLDRPEAQPIIARIGAVVDAEYPHRVDHALRVACVAIRAKRHPSNKFAEPTL